MKKLVDKKVALTSTLTVFETFTPGRPMPPGLDVLLPQLKEQFEAGYARTAQEPERRTTSTLFPKAMALELAFARAGGLLIAGTDPTGGGGVVPGYSNQRQLELLVEAGFTPLEAIRIATLNGAEVSRTRGAHWLDSRRQAGGSRRDRRRSVDDDRRRQTRRDGVQARHRLQQAKLIESVAGKVGLW